VSARIVSAEEARSRLLAAESDVRGVLDYYVSVRDALVTVPDDIRERLTVALAELVVGAADAERDAALARVARLERVLAVEAGGVGAPDGWRPTTGGAWNGKEDNYVYRIAAGRWSWVSRDTRNKVRGRGESPSALEAMEAADAAGEVAT
jgi:hypothetical protein